MNAALALILAAAGCFADAEARAAEVTRVTSGSRGAGDWIDVNASLDWTHEQKTASIRRELESQATGGQTTLRNDLVYRQTRDSLRLRADVGVFRDLSLFVALPFVVADDRSLDFDRAAPCVANGTPGCIDQSSSTILRDGILPGFGMASYGWDATHARPFQSPSNTVFRGPTRHGIEHLDLGATLAVMNQERDDIKPTWLVRVESRFSVGEPERYDPSRPTDNRSVAPGYHQLVLSTIASRRFRSLEPFLGGWYMLPFAPGGAFDPKLQKAPGGATGKAGAAAGPQQRGGVDIGVEAIAWDEPRAYRRIAFELHGSLELRTAGLAQTELWEPLSGAARCSTDATACRRDVDRDVDGDGMVDPNPGVTRAPAYGVFGGSAGLSVRAGRFLRFRGLFGLSYEETHFLTDGNSGHPIYDSPGRRFRVEDGRSWSVLLEGGLLLF